MKKASLVKGTRDFGPKQVQKRKYIFGIIEKVFRKYGFAALETPSMENLSTLTGKYGDEGDQLLFKILKNGAIQEKAVAAQDEKGFYQSITDKGLRYDLTVPFARFVSMNRHEIKFPFKRYQMQQVWRADRPQKGRYREFWQCDADSIGTESLICEMECLSMFDQAFDQLNIPVNIPVDKTVKMGAPSFWSFLTFVVKRVKMGAPSFWSFLTFVVKRVKMGAFRGFLACQK